MARLPTGKIDRREKSLKSAGLTKNDLRRVRTVALTHNSTGSMPLELNRVCRNTMRLPLLTCETRPIRVGRCAPGKVSACLEPDRSSSATACN